MDKLKHIILLSLLAVVAIACGGGGGGGSDSGDSSSSLGFRFSGGKEGDAIYVYGLDGTFESPSPFVSSANYVDGVAAIELDEGDYRVRLNTKSNNSENSFETMEFVILSSDFDRLVNGSLDMGEMNAASTYISAKVFSSAESSSSDKPRMAAANVLTALESYLTARNLSSLSQATLENLATNSEFSSELIWVHLLEISLKRLDATTNTDSSDDGVSKWNSVISSVVSMANDVEENGSISSDSITAYLSATSYLSDIDLSEINDGNSLYGADNIQNILNLAQSKTATNFNVNYTTYTTNIVADEFARVDLSDGSVTFSDEITLASSDNSSFMVFAKIPASTNYKYRGASANNTIELTEYYMSIYEVTQAQYAQLATLTVSESDNPVSDITYTEASTYISSLDALNSDLDFSLPTEAQWENAARAGTDDATFGEDFSTSDSETEDWITANNGGLTSLDEPVGTRAANPYDLYDIHGNVAEMCLDSLTDANLNQVDPVGSSSNIAIRGGSYFNYTSDCTVGSKSTASTSNHNPAIGFRVVFKK